VNDDPKERERIVETLRNIKDVDGVDLIIALGMAKEGFRLALVRARPHGRIPG